MCCKSLELDFSYLGYNRLVSNLVGRNKKKNRLQFEQPCGTKQKEESTTI